MNLDPKMTVMSGGDKEKAADYANCTMILCILLSLCHSRASSHSGPGGHRRVLLFLGPLPRCFSIDGR